MTASATPDLFGATPQPTWRPSKGAGGCGRDPEAGPNSDGCCWEGCLKADTQSAFNKFEATQISERLAFGFLDSASSLEEVSKIGLLVCPVDRRRISIGHREQQLQSGGITSKPKVRNRRGPVGDWHIQKAIQYFLRFARFPCIYGAEDVAYIAIGDSRSKRCAAHSGVLHDVDDVIDPRCEFKFPPVELPPPLVATDPRGYRHSNDGEQTLRPSRRRLVSKERSKSGPVRCQTKSKRNHQRINDRKDHRVHSAFHDVQPAAILVDPT